jgi:hypothetical protein
VGLVLAELVGAAAVGLAVRWTAEPIAGVGLVGAIAATSILGGGSALLTATFATVAFGAFARVGARMQWGLSLVSGALLTLPALLDLSLDPGHGDATWPIVLLGGGFALATLEAACRWQSGRPRPTLVGAGLLATSAGMSAALALGLFSRGVPGPDPQGAALALAGLAYLAAAAWLWRRSRDSAGGALAVGLGFLAGGLVLLAGGVERVAALAAATALLAWLAGRVGERRIAAAATSYLAVTVGACVAVAAPWHLLDPERARSVSVAAFVPVALASAALAVWWRHPADRRVAIWIAAAAALVTVSALALAAAMAVGGGKVAFQGGHTAMSLVWAAAGLGILSFLAVGAALLAGGVLVSRASGSRAVDRLDG